MMDTIEVIRDSATELQTLAKTKLAQVSVIGAELEKIKAAIGARNRKKAGVQ